MSTVPPTEENPVITDASAVASDIGAAPEGPTEPPPPVAAVPDEAVVGETKPATNDDAMPGIEEEPLQQDAAPEQTEPVEEESAAGIGLVEDEPSQEARLLVDTEARLRAVSGAYAALRAEMRAFQDRTERLKDEMDRRRRGEAVAAIFEPVQNLRRSLDAFKRMDVQEEVIQGIELVLGQFLQAMEKLGLEEIRAEGANFDPNIHEAMGTVVTTRPELDGRVLQVFDTGYRIGNTVVQPARVIIGAYQEPAGEE